MPIQSCTLDGKPGYKWGPNGACYTYTPGNTASKARARLKADQQGVAISYSQKREGQTPDIPVKG